MLDLSLKGLGIGSSLKAHRLSHPTKAHRGDQSQVLAPVLGHSTVSSISFWSPRPQAIHRDVRPGLVHEHKAPEVEARNKPLPQSSGSLIAFLGYLGLFLSGHSPGSLRILRLIVASETSMELSSKKAWQCSDKVSSGLEFSCSGSHCLKALPFTEGLPGILWMVTSPVRRLLLSQRLMVERESPKRSWTSFLGMPRSMAESTFSLRSFEYAFMDLFLYRSAT